MSIAEDIQKLKENPSEENRRYIVDKISNFYKMQVFEAKEKALAEEVFELLVNDTAISVRHSLAENLKNCDDLPHPVALQLAKDIEAVVSTPMLEYSNVLTDQDLFDIIQSTSTEVWRVTAIAKRQNLSDLLANAIIDTRKDAPATSLMKNDKSSFKDPTYTKTVDHFHHSDPVMHALVNRGHLSPQVIEHILATVSEELKHELVNTYHLSHHVADKMVQKSYEQFLTSCFGFSDDSERIVQMVEHLMENGRLTSSLLLQALCKGNLSFFEVSLSQISHIPLKDVHATLLGRKPAAIRALLKASHLPDNLIEATTLLLEFMLTDIEHKQFQQATFVNRLLERILSQGYDKSVPSIQQLLLMLTNKA